MSVKQTAQKSSKEKKLGFRRLLSNVFFVFQFAYRHDKVFSLQYITSECVHIGATTFLNTFILKAIIEELTAGADLVAIGKLLLFMFVVDTIQLAIHIGLENGFNVRLVKVSGEIQRELMKKAQQMDLKCYDIPEYYDDFVIAAAQSEEMVTKAIKSVAQILSSILAMLIAGTMILTVKPAVAIFPVVGFIINIVTRFAITKLEYQYEIEKAKIGRKADYSKRVFYQPEYAKEIKLTGIEEALMEQYDEAITEEKKMAIGYSLKILPLTLINWIFTYTVCQFFAVQVYLAYLAIVEKSIELGDVASLRNATNRIKSQLDTMNYALVDFQKVGQYAERFRRFMEYQVNIEGCMGEVPVPEDSTLELHEVGFRYKDSERFVLRHVSLKICKGEKLALVGENGAGKSTLIKLLIRLYDVTEGSITYGGVDIRKLNIKEYRDQIGAVFQDFQIYGASLAENVKMDFVDKEDRENITNALKRADLGGKLQKLVNGIDTELTKEFSEYGTMLSGGEAQKAAIARMFMRDMPVAILDEPSSALDPIAEYRLNKSMLENVTNQAVILISHRLSTTKDADRIILLENGTIAESGSHEELLAQNGMYAQMWNVQAEKYKYFS